MQSDFVFVMACASGCPPCAHAHGEGCSAVRVGADQRDGRRRPERRGIGSRSGDARAPTGLEQSCRGHNAFVFVLVHASGSALCTSQLLVEQSANVQVLSRPLTPPPLFRLPPPPTHPPLFRRGALWHTMSAIFTSLPLQLDGSLLCVRAHRPVTLALRCAMTSASIPKLCCGARERLTLQPFEWTS